MAKSIFHGAQRIITPGELEQFVARSVRGAELVYCEAPDLIRGATADKVRELTQAGYLTPHNRRRAGGGLEFFVRRTARVHRRGPPPPIISGIDARANGCILRALKRAANLDMPCPTLNDLVKALAADGLQLTRNQVQARILKLVDAGTIRSTVLYDSGVQVRVVTIVATGKRTALPPKWALAERAARADAQPQAGAARG